MNKIDSLNVHSSSIKKDKTYQSGFKGTTFDSFKTQNKVSTNITKDSFVSNNPPASKSANLKNLLNAVPDSYLDEIVVGGVAIAVTAYKLIKGKNVSRLFSDVQDVMKKNAVLTSSVDGLKETLNNVQNKLNPLEALQGTVSKFEDDIGQALKTAQNVAKSTTDIVTARTGILSGDVNVNNITTFPVAKVMHGYGEKQAGLEYSLRTEATRRIYGLTQKVLPSGDDIVVRVPTSEFKNIAATGGMGAVPPELMANLSALINEKQNVRFVLDMPLYYGAMQDGIITQLRAKGDNVFDLVNTLQADGQNVILKGLKKIGEMNVPIVTDVAQNTEKVEIFLQKNRTFPVDFNLAKERLTQASKEKIETLIASNQPFSADFGSLRISRSMNSNNELDKPIAQLVHDAVFYKNDKFNLNGPKMPNVKKTFYSNEAHAAGETERFMYFDKFFYEFMIKQKEVTPERIGTDLIIGNDWQTGGISAMTRLLTKAKEAFGELSPQDAEKIYNTPIITIFHNAGLAGSSWHSQPKLLNILFGEHAKIITENAWMPKNAGTMNGLFTRDGFNPQTMAAVYSDTLVPVSKGYGKEIASEAGYGGENFNIFKLREKAMVLSDDVKRHIAETEFEKMPITFANDVQLRNVSYKPITNGCDKVNNKLNGSALEKALALPEGSIWSEVPQGKSVLEWHNHNKSVLLEKLHNDIQIARGAKVVNDPILTEIQLPHMTDLTGVNQDTMVVSTAGRIVEQKGLDIFAEAIDEFMSKHHNMDNPPIFYAQGQGEQKYIDHLLNIKKNIAKKFGEKAANRIVVTGWFNPKVHPGRYDAVKTMSDFSVMSSWFEPCGLVHKEIAATGGAIPIVNKTGGLADGLQDNLTGIFAEFKPKHQVKAELEKAGKAVYNSQSEIDAAQDYLKTSGKEPVILIDEALKVNRSFYSSAIEKAYELFQDKEKFAKAIEASYNSDHSWLKKGGPADEYAKIMVDLGVLDSKIL